MPACIEDVKCAVRWLRAHAKEYNVDPDRIGAYGNSAGAHLVAMLGLCPRSAGLEGDGPWKEYSSMVQAVVCSATPTKFPFTLRVANKKADSARKKSFRSTLFAGPEETLEHRMRQASPVTYVTADAPAFLIIHGTADKTVPVSQSDELAKALRQAGAKDVTYMRIEGAGHGVFGQNIEKMGPAREAFLARTIGSKGLGILDIEPTIKAPSDQLSPEQPNGQASANSRSRNTVSRNAKRIMARWLSMDKDGDGKVNKDEAEGQFKANFERNDANQDGFLERGELDALLQRLSGGRSRGRTPVGQRERNQRTTQQQSGRSRGAQLPAGAKIERDIVYARVGDRKLLLDLCLPAKGTAPLPVIVWVPGGGWRNGSKNSGSRARPMLERGYAVVDVGYRLSGEAIFPAQVEDCKAAVRWVRANAAKYGFDPDRIGAWGSSAGGHLVAFLGTAGDVKEFDTAANAEYSSRVQAVCDWFGPTDFLQMDKNSLKGSRLIHDAPNSPESLLVGGPIQEEPYRSLARKANPITYVTKDDPPFLIMHGDKDMSVPLHQSDLLYDALKRAGVDAKLHVVKGGGHGLRGGEESSEKLFEIVANFFDKHLKRQKPKADTRSRRAARKKPQLRPPTHADVKYGPYERSVLDFYQAESDKPTPIAVYIHGGGFRGGSKRGLNAGTLRELLNAGISVAAVEYRFVSEKPLPAAHHDSLRALQFIRSKASQWNIDKKRIGAFGGSAGAQICMWLAFHEEMAEPSSSDPVERESSRL
ncbi:MAG: alpha/beta hydrolase fold domain-containing protein, partial [Dehalococcoidales bacterium]